VLDATLHPVTALLASAAAEAGAVADPGAALLSVESLVSLLTLTALEIVLGIDNVIFIAILAGKLPAEQQAKARSLGIGAAVISRVLLLLAITWVMGLTKPLVALGPVDFSGKGLILLVGGLFLIGKATFEIHDKLEGKEHTGPARAAGGLLAVVVQIMLIDVVFSLDSVITAVGMARQVPIMIAAVLLAAGVMLVFAGPVSSFVQRHPTMKILALSFLILIGVMLVMEAFGKHVERGYIYFAMAFSFVVELLNLRLRAREPMELRRSRLPEPEAGGGSGSGA